MTESRRDHLHEPLGPGQRRKHERVGQPEPFRLAESARRKLDRPRDAGIAVAPGSA